MTTIYDFSAPLLSGEETALSQFEGKVVLIVNTASKCGFTHQYEGLEALYEKYKDQGLVILGFPCNQFGQQESGTESEIAEFCQINYGVTFPMFAKVEVKGSNSHPLFQYLVTKLPGTLGKNIKWNFTKFLINREGQPIKRYAPTKAPESLESDIARYL